MSSQALVTLGISILAAGAAYKVANALVMIFSAAMRIYKGSHTEIKIILGCFLRSSFWTLMFWALCFSLELLGEVPNPDNRQYVVLGLLGFLLRAFAEINLKKEFEKEWSELKSDVKNWFKKKFSFTKRSRVLKNSN